MARVHRKIVFSFTEQPIPLAAFSLLPAQTLQEAVLATARTIDPCGTFRLGNEGGDITLGIGPRAEPGLNWYLGAEQAIGYLQPEPAMLDTTAEASLRGAGVAACLGAAAAFKLELNVPVAPRALSTWNYLEDDAADPGPQHLQRLDVGRVLLVGAGAVASALVYWLRSWGVEGEWVVIDNDTIKLHNTNRGMLFLPEHAAWPAGPKMTKVSLLTSLLPRAQPVKEWYHKAQAIWDQPFDVVLELANDYGVREAIAHRNATVLLHATTGQNWLSQLHRHVAGRDDCIACRLGEVKEPAFEACSTVTVKTSSEERMDAALPFLSAAAGLMLATLLQRLQAGVLVESTANNWRWDFLSEQRMVAPPGRSKCHVRCSSWYSPEARKKVNQGARWAHLDAS
jgi:hypothetical protein